MAGIFGNNPYDKHLENQLNKYLDSIDPIECKCSVEKTEEFIIINGYEYEKDSVFLKDNICPECENEF